MEYPTEQEQEQFKENLDFMMDSFGFDAEGNPDMNKVNDFMPKLKSVYKFVMEWSDNPENFEEDEDKIEEIIVAVVNFINASGELVRVTEKYGK